MTESKLEAALVKEICIICGKEMDGPIIMNQMLTKKAAEEVKSMNGKCIGYSEKPCKGCTESMKEAFMFIGFYEEKSDMDNLPSGFYRTGHIVGTKKNIPIVQEFVKQHQPKALDVGFIFIPHLVMQKLGLIK